MLRRNLLRAALGAGALAALARGTRVLAKGAAAVTTHDPLLDPWTGKYGGYPPFDKITAADLEAGLERAMAAHKDEIAAITSQKAAASFANTIAAYDDAGRAYGRAATVFGIYRSNLATPEVQAIETKMAPRLAAHDDEITQDAALFARIKAVHDGVAKLRGEEARLTEVTYTNFARQGAALGADDKKRLKEINARLASLYTTFAQNELADEEGYALELGSDAELAGLPDSLRAGAKAAAAAKGKKGWLITNTRSSMEPFLTYSTRRDLREQGWRMWIARGDHGDKHDNKKIITEILQLRAEKAKLLGFPTFAAWSIDDNMAKTPAAASALTMKVWKAAVARVREEVADMQKIADAEKAGIKIAPWDYRFYAEKVRKATYDLDQDEVKGYLQLDKIRDAMFWAAGQLYGFEFVPVTGVPVFHPDVTTYEVKRGGKHVGLWYFDPYARDGKRSGAWMEQYRSQERMKGEVAAIVSNNANFVKGEAGAPVLISWDDARTMFHEFGHALHGLNSDVHYPTLSGTNVKRDFVEFPSQLNEHWLPTKEVLSKFAIHYQTGKVIPDELVAKIDKARHFNQGFLTVEYLMSAIYDLEIHQAPTDKDHPIDPGAFETELMKKIGAPKEIVMRHRPTQFGHVFSGDGYSSGYYDYIWADTLTADAAEAFTEAGGFYDKKVAKRLHDDIMSVGNTIPPDVAFRKFRGRDVDTDALMRDRGFPTS